MVQTEYVRSLNCNYERILLDKKPEEKRYQYCILTRGGIKGLLSCSLRYINGQAYLYYDISSRQNLTQLYGKRCITREWIRDFVWNLKTIRQELERFLLDMRNLIWYPDQIFQDPENHVFSFLYVPYYEGESSFIRLAEFWVEHIDYEDETLVNCVYRIYEQIERCGEDYLQSRIFEDTECLEEEKKEADSSEGRVFTGLQTTAGVSEQRSMSESSGEEQPAGTGKKRSIFGIFEGKKNRSRKAREDYRTAMRQAMTGYAAEDTNYGREEYGRTVYMEEENNDSERTHRLYTSEGRVLANMERPVLSIGKKKEEVDIVLDDPSVSRIHARIIKENENIYLEDLNSTNGTFKNGLRLQPYEKRKLEEEDEIKCGKVILIFR